MKNNFGRTAVSKAAAYMSKTTEITLVILPLLSPKTPLANTKRPANSTEFVRPHQTPQNHGLKAGVGTQSGCLVLSDKLYNIRELFKSMKKTPKRYYLLAASECIFMKHTTVCGKSADRPIGGACPRKARPRTMIETEPTCSPPLLVLDWLCGVSLHEKAEKEIDPSCA